MHQQRAEVWCGLADVYDRCNNLDSSNNNCSSNLDRSSNIRDSSSNNRSNSSTDHVFYAILGNNVYTGKRGSGWNMPSAWLWSALARVRLFLCIRRRGWGRLLKVPGRRLRMLVQMLLPFQGQVHVQIAR